MLRREGRQQSICLDELHRLQGQDNLYYTTISSGMSVERKRRFTVIEESQYCSNNDGYAFSVMSGSSF